MKKLLALVLVLTLVLGMGVGVFAEDDWAEVPITKNLTSQGTNPAETFKFTVGAGTYDGPIADVTAPAFDPDEFSIALAQGALSGSANITLPDFDHVGVYEYEVKEVAGNTAGMDYDGNTYYLRVTVINNEEEGGFIRVLTLVGENDVKKDAFQNEFSAGDLVISKKITGNYALFDDKFDVTVVLTPPEGKVIKEGPIAVSGAVDGIGNVAAPNDKGEVIITFKVTHNSTVKIANIPYGVSYEVSEDSGDYTAYINNVEQNSVSGTIDAPSYEIDIVNELNTQIETGINLDNLPYILILGAATLGLVGFTMRKRFNNR